MGHWISEDIKPGIENVRFPSPSQNDPLAYSWCYIVIFFSPKKSLCFSKNLCVNLCVFQKFGLACLYTANWIRIVSGHNRLADNMYKMKLKDSPDCDCKEARETVEHVIMNCKKFYKEREHLMNRIETIYLKNDVRKDRRGLSFNNILYPEIGGTAASQIRKAVLDFICEVKIKL